MRDVAPLPEGRMILPELPPLETLLPVPSARPPRAAPLPAAPLPALAPSSTPGLDARSAERLRRGEMRIDARLDLHGMTQEEAHRGLDDFLARAHEARKRCVLVITGKGGRGALGGGVLRAAVPRWLNETPNRARLLAFAPAQPKHGGGGALYVLLKRRR